MSNGHLFNIFWYRKIISDIENLNFWYRKIIFRYRKIPWFSDIEKSFSDIRNSNFRYRKLFSYIEKMQPNFWYQKILISDIEKSFFDSGNSKRFSDIGNYFLIKKLFSDIRKYGINVHLTPHIRLNEILLLTSGRNEQKLSLIRKTIFNKIPSLIMCEILIFHSSKQQNYG